VPKAISSTEDSALSLRACLIITSIFWLDVSLVAAARQAITQDVVGNTGTGAAYLVALSSLLMLVPLWLMSAWSRRIGYDLERWPRLLAPHAGVALLFGLSARPAVYAAAVILGDASLVDLARAREAGRPDELALWSALTIENLAHYLVLQGILTAAAYYVRARSEQALRERIARQYDRARLQALRMQTNPHFLFNTLSAITGLIRASPAAAEAMVTRLGDLLRATLTNRDREFVTLARELDLGVQYLDIQRERFGERFDYRIHTDPSLAEAALPPLLLQPLLENAAEYGLSGFDGRIEIDIRCELAPAGLRIFVRNRAEAHVAERRDPARGFGLENVRERLHAAFGDAASFTAELGRDGYFEARIDAPMRSVNA
jgi:hypothetical protein